MHATKKNRIDGPDILRGFAAISVIIVHIIAHSGIDFGPLITHIGSKFTASVTLFFTISAFSIAYTYNDEFINKSDFKDFFIKRFFRLAPLFFMAMLTECIIVYFAYDHLPSMFDVFMSVTFLFNLAPKMQDGIVWGGWSIGIEWVFYLLYPVIFVMCNHKKLIAVIWALSIYVSTNIGKIPGATGVEIYMNILNHMVFFIAGIAVYLWLQELKKLKEMLGGKASIASGAVLLGLFAFLIYYFSLDGYPISIYVCYSLVWIGMISASIIGTPSIINNTFTRFLGKASYSIYLMHGIILYLMESSGFYKWINGMELSQVSKFILAAAIAVSISIFVSNITYHIVELPGMKLGRWVINRKVRNAAVKGIA